MNTMNNMKLLYTVYGNFTAEQHCLQPETELWLFYGLQFKSHRRDI